MATASQWLEGARPRTLPAAVAPVLAGTGVAVGAGSPVWWKAGLALVVSLGLQVGVNYANDYSDGTRGADVGRIGPLRLVGSGVAAPARVRGAAATAFAVAAVAGLVLAATSGWWLVLVGVVAVGAAWFYTGGNHPYGYRGWGEVGVFVFFGLVAVVGTAYVQQGRASGAAVLLGCGVGSLACAILVANNLRDIPGDSAVGKRTLAVALGDDRSRILFQVLHVASYGFAVVAAATTTWWVVLALAAVPLSVRAARPVTTRAVGLALVPVLRDTGLAELVYAVGVLVGFALSLS